MRGRALHVTTCSTWPRAAPTREAAATSARGLLRRTNVERGRRQCEWSVETSLDVELNSKTHKPTCVLATENLLLKSRTSNVN